MRILTLFRNRTEGFGGIWAGGWGSSVICFLFCFLFYFIFNIQCVSQCVRSLLENDFKKEKGLTPVAVRSLAQTEERF